MHLLASTIDEAPIEPASAGVMLLFAAVMMATYVGVAIERFHKTVAALCGAAVLVVLALGLDLFEYPKIYDFLEEDLNIFGVIIGTGILVDVVGKSGLFHFLSMWIVRLTGGRASHVVFDALRRHLLVRGRADHRAGHADPQLAGAGDLPVAQLQADAVAAERGDLCQQRRDRDVCQRAAQHHDRDGRGDSLRRHFLQVSLPYAVVSLVIAIVVLRFFFRNDLPWKQTAEEQAALARTNRIVRSLGAGRRPQGVCFAVALILLATVLGFRLRPAAGRGHGLHRHGRRDGGVAVCRQRSRRCDSQSELDRDPVLHGPVHHHRLRQANRCAGLGRPSKSLRCPDNRARVCSIPLMGGFSAVASSIVDNIPVAATLIPIVKTFPATHGAGRTVMVDADHLLQPGRQRHADRIDLVRDRHLRAQDVKRASMWVGARS